MYRDYDVPPERQFTAEERAKVEEVPYSLTPLSSYIPHTQSICRNLHGQPLQTSIDHDHSFYVYKPHFVKLNYRVLMSKLLLFAPLLLTQ